jgi:ApaG protein
MCLCVKKDKTMTANIATCISNGIKISVETFYQVEHSRPMENKYIFAYRITIENMGAYTVQLMRRHWFIHDSNGIVREVEGEGVIGQQPILVSQGVHQYVSWCHLFADMGKMKGHYTFAREDGELLKVDIPEFQMCAPFKLN